MKKRALLPLFVLVFIGAVSCKADQFFDKDSMLFAKEAIRSPRLLLVDSLREVLYPFRFILYKKVGITRTKEKNNKPMARDILVKNPYPMVRIF